MYRSTRANSLLKASSLDAVLACVSLYVYVCVLVLPPRCQPYTALHFPTKQILAPNFAPEGWKFDKEVQGGVGSSTMQQGGAPQGQRSSTALKKREKAEAKNPELREVRAQNYLQGQHNLFFNKPRASDASGNHNPITSMRDGHHSPGCHGH
jgi:hypothetical protein